jgi:hypothetical protein
VLWSIFTKTKSKNEIQETKNCIYSVPYKHRKKSVGETGRPLNTRISKHEPTQVWEKYSSPK